MKASRFPFPKALEEVREWKEAVYQDTKDMTTEQRIAYFHEGLEEAARALNCRLVKNPDGSYRFVGKDQDSASRDE